LVASQQGALMPKNAIAKLLQEMGQPLPTLKTEEAPKPPMVFSGEGVLCKRCQQKGPKLEKAPQPGELGKKILENVCQNCWKEWLAMGVKVINELQLDFTRPGAAAVYDQHMLEFLNLQDQPPPGLNFFNLPVRQ